MENGQRWARWGLIAGVIVSIAGNIANASLTEARYPGARIALAIVWPFFLFIGVEVLVRNRTVSGALARFGQAGLLMTAVPTAITSYVNLHALMIKATEPEWAQYSGPIAIDGLMLGCTVMLLAARAEVLTVEPELTMDIVPQDVAIMADASATQPIDPAFTWTDDDDEMVKAVVEPQPVRTRQPRGEISPALKSAIVFLIEGVPASKIETGPGASPAVVGRYARVVRILRADPHAAIDAEKEKVRPVLVDEIRAAMRELGPR